MKFLQTAKIVLVLTALFLPFGVYAERPFVQRKGNQVIYQLNIDYKSIRPAGKDVQSMLINQTLPGPTLYFKEGDQAVIYVKNNMDQETSLHWHGILLPNFQDGVPYLTTPPILPGQTYRFEFPIKHSGTYWYHSHTDLQEQRGVFGGIVIYPKVKKHQYDKDLVLHLSDWSNEHPDSIMRTLKRGSEWYSIKKDLVQSLDRVIRGKALLPQLKMWQNKMPGMDISDVYYEAFLVNGKQKQNYPQFQGGETIRLRWINASASTYFWLSLGGSLPKLISADGVDVQPVKGNRLLHAIGETYDFLLTIPKGKSVELKAVAQDGSGEAIAILGEGPLLKASVIPKYDPIEDMKGMEHDHDFSSHRGGVRTGSKAGKGVHGSSSHGKEHTGDHETDHKTVHKQGHKTDHKTGHKPNHNTDHKLITYDHLKAVQTTNFSKNKSVKELNLNLTGNMWRYVWSMNGKVLSESDIIPIQKNQVLRMKINNKTMMHHPMHLHGHFFRVLNKNGVYSPLKHTVDVPPMESVVLEFESNEPGDWFFHCHVLYHMKGGMARIFRYGNQRDKRLKSYPLSLVMDMDRQWYMFMEWDVLSNHSDFAVEFSNTRNKIILEGMFSWFDRHYKELDRDFELELSYERFWGDYFRPYIGADMESLENGTDFAESVFRLGFRYLLPYLVDLDLSLDHRLRVEIGLDYELLLFPRLELFADWTWSGNFGWLEKLPEGQTLIQEYEWFLGLEYIMAKNFSLTGRYDNDLGWAGGIHLKF